MSLYVDIEKKLGDFQLKVSFEANDGIFALLGASGCGKSMTLKCIAGIERPDRGRIVLGGRVLFDSEQGINLKPQERRAGYLFQQYALFPNMTVRQNIRCGVRRVDSGGRLKSGIVCRFRRKKNQRVDSCGPLESGSASRFRRKENQRVDSCGSPESGIVCWLRRKMCLRGDGVSGNALTSERQIDAMIRALRLDGTEDRKPGQLSGGQQQRVALARILINEPDVVMLDEPFSSLDSHLRFSLERDVRHLMQEYGKVVLLVSHDRDEVFRMADHVAIMDDGRIETVGSRYSVFMDPKTVRGAFLTGCKNVTECRPVSFDSVRADAWGLTLDTGRDVTGKFHVGIRMHDVHIRESSGQIRKDRGLSAIPDSVLKAANFEAWREQDSTLRTTDFKVERKQDSVLRTANFEAWRKQEGNRNVFHCYVTEEIENPFSYTVMLKTSEGCEAFGMELNKQKWDAARRKELDVYIPAEAILLLE
ncbi:MAG: ATP-binding cassette domain-containing protein [Lachnospiraceae bacterium]|nr:ATP-binding cassette domain-containing protein [Lachnospiraceae bacterium]